MEAINSHERRIVLLIHPDAVGNIQSPRWGGMRTEIGPCGYGLNTGERIAL